MKKTSWTNADYKESSNNNNNNQKCYALKITTVKSYKINILHLQKIIMLLKVLH